MKTRQLNNNENVVAEEPIQLQNNERVTREPVESVEKLLLFMRCIILKLKNAKIVVCTLLESSGDNRKLVHYVVDSRAPFVHF